MTNKELLARLDTVQNTCEDKFIKEICYALMEYFKEDAAEVKGFKDAKKKA